MNRAFSLFLLGLLIASSSQALEGENILVVANKNIPPAKELALFYIQSHHVPPSNLLLISCPEEEEIDYPTFKEQILDPLANFIKESALQDRLLVILLIKGIPHKIKGTGGINGTQATVDSELSLLRSQEDFPNPPREGPLPNPYYASYTPFDSENFHIYLVLRLDGYTFEDAKSLITRSLKARADGEILLDGKGGEDEGELWLREASTRLRARKVPVFLDDTPLFITNRTNLIGYASWGSNDPAYPPTRKLELQFLPGAIGEEFVSTNARTFTQPPPTWQTGSFKDEESFFAGSPQGLIGDLIRLGITGCIGYAYEPYLTTCARPLILFDAYTRGFTLAESFYMSLPYISWRYVVIGDPLTHPYPEDFKELPSDTTGIPLFLAVLNEQKDPDKALSLYKEALSSPVRREQALLGIIRSYLAKQDPESALKYAEALKAEYPTKSSYTLLLSSCLALTKDYKGAISILEEALKEHDEPRLHLEAGKLYILSRGDLQKANTHLEKVLESSPSNPSARYWLALAYALQGKQKEASEILDKLLSEDKTFPERALAERLARQLKLKQ